MQKEHSDLAAENFYLAKFIANKFRWTGMEIEDLVGICGYALCRAAESFDESRGIKFSTYAGQAMRLSVIREHLRNKHQKFIQKYGSLRSIDDRINEVENLTLADTLGKNDARLELTDYIDQFSDLDRQWLRLKILYHVHGYNQQELAEVIGVSQVQVSRLLNKAPNSGKRKARGA